jgi:hypothetical protein
MTIDIHGFRDHSGMPATFQALLLLYKLAKIQIGVKKVY